MGCRSSACWSWRHTDLDIRAGVGREVEAIGNLDRIRCALATARGVGSRTIANDDLHAGALAEPVGEHLGSAVV
jgi:hypothetical protein